MRSHSQERGNQNSPQMSILDESNIIKAFEIMLMNNQQNQLIKEADQYLHQCQNDPSFTTALIAIFSNIENSALRWQILLHLKTVLKRVWPSRKRFHGGINIEQNLKSEIKERVLNLYKIYWREFHQQFNGIFKILAKDDYPVKYSSLENFIVSTLANYSNLSVSQISQNDKILPQLSLVKTVFKEITQGKLILNNSIFLNHLIEPVKFANVIQEKIIMFLVSMRDQGVKNFEIASKMLECSCKIDKIILYSLTVMNYQTQVNPQIINLLTLHVDKISLLLEIYQPNFTNLIQANLCAIVECLCKLQASFFFAFSSFLRKYLQTILKLLFQDFESERLSCTIIQANIKPFSTFAYYMFPTQFKNSMFYKKHKQLPFENQQIQCNKIYLEIYGGENTCGFLEKIITILMIKYCRQQQEDELIFEDNEIIPETINQKGAYDWLIQLAKTIMTRFASTVVPFTTNIIKHLLESTIQIKQDVILGNMFEIILLLPSTLEEENLNMSLIFDLLDKMYRIQDFKNFTRLVRYYEGFFNSQTISKSFKILTQIISRPNINHVLLYQCATCLKKILYNNAELDLPIEYIGYCFTKILPLLSIYKDNPNHLWNIMNLFAQIIRVLSDDALLLNLPIIIQNLNLLILIENNGALIIAGIGQMLEKIVELFDWQKITLNQTLINLFSIIADHISLGIPKLVRVQQQNQDNINSLLRLWVISIKVYPINIQSLNTIYNSLFNSLNQTVRDIDPVTFIELVEEYIICRLITLTDTDLLNLFTTMLSKSNPDIQSKITIALFSLYYTFSIINNMFIQDIIMHAMTILRQLTYKFSSTLNTQRSIIYLIISHHINVYGAQNMLSLLQRGCNNYQEWLQPLVWSLEYLNQKYASKVIAIALLSCLQLIPSHMLQTPINQTLPVAAILKFILTNVHQISQIQAMNTYMNSIRIAQHKNQNRMIKIRIRYSNANKNFNRKIKLHVNTEWGKMNLRGPLREIVLELEKKWRVSVGQLCSCLDDVSSRKIEEILNNV